jgi:hypothetical protein
MLPIPIPIQNLALLYDSLVRIDTPYPQRYTGRKKRSHATMYSKNQVIKGIYRGFFSVILRHDSQYTPCG